MAVSLDTLHHVNPLIERRRTLPSAIVAPSPRATGTLPPCAGAGGGARATANKNN